MIVTEMDILCSGSVLNCIKYQNEQSRGRWARASYSLFKGVHHELVSSEDAKVTTGAVSEGSLADI